MKQYVCGKYFLFSVLFIFQFFNIAAGNLHNYVHVYVHVHIYMSVCVRGEGEKRKKQICKR